ncbi:hypothetical protein AU186_19810 [Mycobacterium sp. GA-1999]|nr:hypothetical protein AU185_03315 [Mycobacterium sp. GA-0227b]KUH91145.1 hypothetical protein AU186_19810 [Mycobacterium sp. GA-1999]KUH95497.1 hypothetical protein AU187_11165 [Mycobacterium sp. IS-1556]
MAAAGPAPAQACAVARAIAADAVKQPSIVHPIPGVRPFLASSTSATPATMVSTPATVERVPVAPTGASHHGRRRCSSGESSRNIANMMTANTTARSASRVQKPAASTSYASRPARCRENAAMAIATMCQRYSVIAPPFPIATTYQTRGRSAHRRIAPAQPMKTADIQVQCNASSSVGGDTFDRCSVPVTTSEIS